MTTLFRYKKKILFEKAARSPEPHSYVAQHTARWLDQVAEQLEEHEFFFEAAEAADLAERFRAFCLKRTRKEALGDLWEDLSDFGAQSVTLNTGRERAICEIPPLPVSYL